MTPNDSKADDTITIIAEHVRYNRFTTRLEAGSAPVVEKSATPLLSSARALMARGYNPNATLMMRHAKDAFIAMRGRLGRLAKLTVAETPNGPKFTRWRDDLQVAVPGDEEAALEAAE